MNRLALVAAVACAATLAAAQDQQPQHRPGWPCVGRPDPTYFRIAEATGGQVFLFDPSEIADSGVLSLAAMRHDETIFRVAGSLEEGLHEFPFPIDSTVESALFSVSLQCLQVVEIVRPSGDVLAASAEGVDYHQFEAGRIVILKAPEPGTWRVRVSGHGLFFLVAQARSTLSLDRVDFVENGGRPGHKGLFPTDRPPRAGAPATLRIVVSGPARDVRARLVTASFEDIAALPLAAASGDGDQREFLAEVTPPAGGFRVVVTGADERGLPFARVHAPLFESAAK